MKSVGAAFFLRPDAHPDVDQIIIQYSQFEIKWSQLNLKHTLREKNHGNKNIALFKKQEIKRIDCESQI